MAAKKDSSNLSYSQLNAGDEYFDQFCTPCYTRHDRNKKAAKYCVNCGQYLCTACVEAHDNFPVMSGHVLLHPKNMEHKPGTSVGKFHALPTELCKTHHPKLVDMYCGDHDTVGCSVCITLYHKSCKSLHYIPEYVQTDPPTKQIKQVSDELPTAIKIAESLKRKHDRCYCELEKCKDTCKREIQSYRKEINNVFDKLETATLLELETMYNAKAKTRDDGKKTIGDIHDILVKFKSDIESDECNDSQKFVIAKLLVEVVKRAKELDVETMKRDILKLVFTKNAEITSWLSKVKGLGVVQEQLPRTSLETQLFHPIKPLPRVTFEELYSVLDRQEFPIKIQEDKNSCDIYSSCVVDDGSVLLADNLNSNVKLIDGKTNLVKSSLALIAKPLSVCVVSRREAAVCLEGRSVQFVSTCDKLVATRSLLVSYGRKVIAASNENIYIGMRSVIDIYTMSGENVKEIKNNASGTALFSYINDIIVNDVGSMIYVTDRYEGVIALDTDGNVIWKYSSKQLSGPLGICSGGNNKFFVCDLFSHNVIQLGPNGKHEGEVVAAGDQLVRPKTICYSKKYGKIFVGRFNDKITVLSVRRKLVCHKDVVIA